MDVSSPQEPQEWEQHFYQQACAWAREAARTYLQQLDDQLLQAKPPGWRVVGKRQRTVVTRFGEVSLERRLYRMRKVRGAFCWTKRFDGQGARVGVPR